jgi:hypothetical protein
VNILAERFEEMRSAGVAAFFFDLVIAAEGQARVATRFYRGQTRPDKLLDLLIEMKAQLVVEFALDGVCAETGRGGESAGH